MTPSEATELVAYLVAVFRPRDFGEASAAAYAQSIGEFDYHEAAKAVRWIAEHDTFMPALGRLRAEIGDDYDAPMLTQEDREALPHYQLRQKMLAGEVETPKQAAARVPDVERPGRIEDAHIPYDLEQFRNRKAEVHEAAERERARLEAEKPGES